MAKKKEVKPIPMWIAVVAFLVFLIAAGTFLTYLFTNVFGAKDIDQSSLTQSFEAESSEAPSQVIEMKEHMSDAQKGDAVVFGSYEQNGDTSDGSEKLEWIVLEKQDDKLLLISRYCIDAVPFNNDRLPADWANSSLKSYLNNEFINNAFSEAEKANLLESENGKVFILSAEEAVNYYEYDAWRAGIATDYAALNGARVESDSAWWWLRDAGTIENTACYVHFDGTVQTKGFAVDYDAVGVRPVIWVSAEAETETEHTSNPDVSVESSSIESSEISE